MLGASAGPVLSVYHIYIYRYIYIEHIYIYREREREREHIVLINGRV